MPPPLPVSADNFVRAETHHRLALAVRRGGWGAFAHLRDPPSHAEGGRPDRDMIVSEAVFDLDAGPATIALPDAGGRFMVLQAIDEDHHVLALDYGPGIHTFSRGRDGTRYLHVAVRLAVDADDADDLAQARALQDEIAATQAPGGRLELPRWDLAGLKTVREALLALRPSLPDLHGALGPREALDPVRHLIATAAHWGAPPPVAALQLDVTPEHNDGVTAYRISVSEVPVDGFWSITVYDTAGRPVHDPGRRCTLRSLAAKADADGVVDVQFGGCEDETPNCLPIVPGWNYVVRLWRPREELLSGEWVFPPATLAK